MLPPKLRHRNSKAISTITLPHLTDLIHPLAKEAILLLAILPSHRSKQITALSSEYLGASFFVNWRK